MAKERKYIGNSRAFSIILKVLGVLVMLLSIICLIKSCNECSYRANIVNKTGYLPDNENWDNIPNIQPPYNDDDTLNLPESVMLEHFFPPIGNQGDKGTCVAWAVGYNLKTALNAIAGKWTTDDLAQPSHQTSPKDLWLCIPQEQKGDGCSGTGFEPAFNTLMTKGAATMLQVPYQDLLDCSGVGIGDSSNRIEAYYHVVSDGEIPKLGQLKAYLADTIPLVIGGHLGDNFINWHSDNVIKTDTYRRTGMHAFHAMALVGYDDNRRAFRLRNSWGEDWGDNGSIWVDYEFFCRELCFVVFIAENRNDNNN